MLDIVNAFMTIKEFASTVKCSQPAVRVWLRQGLPARRFGRLIRIDLQAALDWFEARAQRRGWINTQGEKPLKEDNHE